MDNSDSPCEPRAKRQKVKHNKSAFERLKELKGKGVKNKYEVSDIENVYEEMDEREYSKKVLERQDHNWIVDDDGSGYVEDGREIFDDDLDSESIASASKNSESKKKKKNVSKAAGKGNIQSLLSNMPEKKKETVNLEQDDILSDVLSGIDESTSSKTSKSNEFSIKSAEKSAKDYLKHFSAPKPIKIKMKTHIAKPEKPKPAKILEELPIENNINIETDEMDTVDEIIESVPTEIIETGFDKKESEFIEQDYMDVSFDDDFNVDEIDEMCEAKDNAVSAEEKCQITENDLICGWETMQDGVANENPDESFSLDGCQLPLVTNSEGEQVFRFYWWDAYEDSMRQPGVVFMFGKTYVESAKSYVSCCVAVRNIERKVYLLPRPFHLDEDRKTETSVPVKIIDVYREFNEEISDRLNIQQFRSRKVTMNYAFDPTVPTTSDYLEVRYSAKNNPLDSNTKGKSFSRVFGTQTSFLEILLIDQKIKGPCWIEIKNPKPVTNPLSWCKLEVNCLKTSDLCVPAKIKNNPPPPLVVATLNIRTVVNKSMVNEIVMIGCLVHNKYCVDKQPPNPPFQQHFCVFTKPSHQMLPLDCQEALANYKGTQVEKCDSEKALLNIFLSKFAKIDPDLVVGHDLLDFHINMLCTRLEMTKAAQWSRFGKLKRTYIPTQTRFQKSLMIGRLVCDLKVSARELIKSRSYDLDTLCQTVLKLKDGERTALESGDVIKLFSSSELLLKLISLTMQDAAYITKMMYEMNVLPLALQITNIAGNVMSKTLQGGRAQRNEFLLLHAFANKNYIAPDKLKTSKNKEPDDNDDEFGNKKSSRKKPAYSGGLVLDPKVGFYDTLILLMDFNSLYPSIIQEYNICFTTMPATMNPDTVLTAASSEPGILPTEIRKLVESRRDVKKLMANPDISNDLRMQYDIRQLALKLTANSMYGCLGFSNSRFYAKHLASLVTMRGRDILMHTKEMVENMNYEVVYGDTDSIMINTKILDFDKVFKIGSSIKQAVNKCYRQIELDVDGVFRYMLLLKKKKYAAVTMSKSKDGKLVLKQEHKGLDIVRRDWSMLASEVGKMVLNHILSEQQDDERIENVQSVLKKVANDLESGQVPLPLLVITKQLTKDPALYTEKTALSHVLVAARFNKKGGKPLGQGDTVPYVICDDGTTNSATQRAYHIEELKHSDTLKIDVKYYLTHQIHPVVSRLCEPIVGLDAYQIANSLGIDASSFKQNKPKQLEVEPSETNVRVKKFQTVEPFSFTCPSCKEVNVVSEANLHEEDKINLWLSKCVNEKCALKPYQYLHMIQNKMILKIKEFVEKYYEKILICEDPLCPNETSIVPIKFAGQYPVCNLCNAGVMYRKYSETDLYNQISFYNHICNLTKVKKVPIHQNLKICYEKLRETTEYFLKKSGYSVVNCTLVFKNTSVTDRAVPDAQNENLIYEIDENEEEDYEQ